MTLRTPSYIILYIIPLFLEFLTIMYFAEIIEEAWDSLLPMGIKTQKGKIPLTYLDYDDY